jgi:hypothetical protein
VKKSALKRDPAKLREFTDRGRGGIKTNPDRTRAFIERGRQSSAKALREAAERPARTARRKVHFSSPGPASGYVCAWPGCEKAGKTWHHWLMRQHLKAYVDTLRLRDEGEERGLLRQLLRDPRNIDPFCGDHHGSHGTNSHRFELEQVPASAFEFAGELGSEWAVKLERTYRPQQAASSGGPEPASAVRGR